MMILLAFILIFAVVVFTLFIDMSVGDWDDNGDEIGFGFLHGLLELD